MKQKTILIFLLFVTSLHLAGQNRKANIKHYFSNLAINKQFNGGVIVAEKGKIIYKSGFGFADFSNKTLNSENIAFPIASLTKTLTATAILQLAESKKLNIGDAVKKYLPQFPYPNITLQHLLSHTSGLPAYNAYFDSTRKLYLILFLPMQIFYKESQLTPSS